jgi:hypothetical protein
MTRRRGLEGERGNVAIIAALTAMVVVMAVTALTLNKNSPLIAARPQITTSEPGTTGEGDAVPVRARTGIERSIEGSPEPRAQQTWTTRSGWTISNGEVASANSDGLPDAGSVSWL